MLGERREISDQLDSVQRSVGTLGGHLRNAAKKHEEVEGELRRLADRLARLAEEEPG